MCHAIMYDNHNSMIIILEHHSSKPMMLLPYQAASWRQASEPYPLDRLYQVHVEILYHYPVSLIVSARVPLVVSLIPGPGSDRAGGDGKNMTPSDVNRRDVT